MILKCRPYKGDENANEGLEKPEAFVNDVVNVDEPPGERSEL